MNSNMELLLLSHILNYLVLKYLQYLHIKLKIN